MSEQVIDSQPSYELSKHEHLLSDLTAPGKTFEELIDVFDEGAATGAEVFVTLTWLQYAVDRKTNVIAASASTDRVRNIVNFVDVEARHGRPATGSLGPSGGIGFASVSGALEKDHNLNIQAQTLLAEACEVLVQEGLLKAEGRLPLEISQDAAVNEVMTDAYTLLSELAETFDNQDDRIRVINTQASIAGIFHILHHRLETGAFRVFMTHGKEASLYSRPLLSPGVRVIELQAEAADGHGEAIREYCKAAGLKPDEVEAQTGMTFGEIGLRYVLMHELGHALHMAPMATEAISAAFLIENPGEAVSSNFVDALYAEKERVAEGLALYYLQGLFIRSGIDDARALDSITNASQREWLVSKQEWYAKSKDNTSSLGKSDRNSMHGGNLGYGLSLDGADLLERFDYVGRNLAVDNGFADRLAGERGVTDIHGSGWAKFLEANEVDLKPVHDAAQQAAEDAQQHTQKLEKQIKRDKKAIGVIAAAGLLGVGAIAGMLHERNLDEDTQVVDRQTIEAADGHTYIVDQVLPDGRVVFELDEAATAVRVEAAVAQLGYGNFVVGQDRTGRNFYVGRDLQQLVEDTEADAYPVVINEIYQRLPAELKTLVGESPELQTTLSELMGQYAEQPTMSEEAMIFKYDLEKIIAGLQAEVDKK